MRLAQFLNREQIAALPLEQVEPAYEHAKSHLDSLLDKVQKDRDTRALLQAEIIATKIQYVLLRFRKYPEHFKNIHIAAYSSVN